VWVVAATLCVVLAVAVFALGTVYLAAESARGAQRDGDAAGVAGDGFFGISPWGSREALAGAHVVFLAAMVLFAAMPAGRRPAARMTGVAVVLGLMELAIAGLGSLLADPPAFAPPQMTVAALGLLLLLGGAGLSLERAAARLRTPKAPVVVVFAVAVAAAAVAFGLVGALSVRHYARIDYTRAGRYSLPPATERLLAGLDKRVRITTLLVVRSLRDDALSREVTDLLDEYARLSSRIELRHVDLRRDVKAVKELAARLAVRKIRPEENAVILECPDTGRAMMVAEHEMIQTVEPDVDAREIARAARGESIDAAETEFRFLGESVLHQALSVVTETEPVTLYFVVGHGEKPYAVGPRVPDLSPEEYKQIRTAFSTSSFNAALRRRYYRLHVLDLNEAGAVPGDCDVLVIAGPWCLHTAQYWERHGMLPFTPKAARGVRAYLERGGAALVMIDPVGRHAGRIAPLLALLRDYGVEPDTAHVAIDERLIPQVGSMGRIVLRREPSALYSVSLARAYGAGDGPPRLHPSIATLGDVTLTVVEAAEIHTRPRDGLRHTPLLTTSGKSWLQPQPVPGRPYQDGDREAQERRTLAVAVEQAGSARPVMVVVGCSNLFIEPMLRFNNVAENGEFGRKALAWLSGSTERLAVKPTETAYGRASPTAVRVVQFTSVVLVPSVFVLIGAIVWLGRRE
jgi:hypothetical protein